MNVAIIRSYCRNCAANCGTRFEVDGGKVLDHAPDRENLVSSGFICVKGGMAVDLLTGVESRLTTSMRRGAAGSLEPIDTADALGDITQRLAAVIRDHGPRALALYYGTAAYSKSFTIPAARAFLAAVGTPNLFSTMTIDSSAHWVCEGRMGVFRTGRPHIEDVDLLLLSGTNPIVSHMAFASTLPANQQARHIRALRERGGQLVVIDPRQTETARLADLHIHARPGYDAQIFAAVINITLERGWHDKAFSERYLSHVGELARAVAPFRPEWVEQLAGITQGTLLKLAVALRDARRPSLSVGTGVSMSPHANVAVHLAYALNALHGGFARAGDPVRHPGFFFRRATCEGVNAPDRSWERGPKLRSGHGLVKGEFGSSRLIDEMTMDGPDRIRALIVVGANPAMAFGEPARMAKALAGLELLVVLDPRLTETAALADFVITTPIAYEVEDFTFFNDAKFGAPFVQHTEPVLPPAPYAIQEWTFFHELARGLGLTLELASTVREAPALTLTHDREWSDEDLIEWRFDQAGLSLDEVRASPGGMLVDVPDQLITGPDHDDGARLDLCPADVTAELAAALSAGTADGYRYRLVVRRVAETLNSAFRFSAKTLKRLPTNPLYIHPADAEQEGLCDGDLAEVTGEHGSLRAYVRTDESLRPGTLAMTHCWSALDPSASPLALHGGHTSQLVSMQLAHVQDIDAMPMQSALPVNLVRIEHRADVCSR